MKKFFKMLLDEAVTNMADRLTLMSQAVEILERIQTGSSDPEKLLFDIDESNEGYVCRVDEATNIIFNFGSDRILDIVVHDTKINKAYYSNNYVLGEFTFHDMKGNTSQYTTYYSHGVSKFNTEQYFKELNHLADLLRFYRKPVPVVTDRSEDEEVLTLVEGSSPGTDRNRKDTRLRDLFTFRGKLASPAAVNASEWMSDTFRKERE